MNVYGLDCKVLNFAKDDRAEWLKLRKTGIGGSDVGAILGINSFKSAMGVWLDKTTDNTDEQSSEIMYWGNVLEDVVAKEFATRHPELKVSRVNAMLASNEHSFALASIDRLLINAEGERGILEIKTTNAFNSSAWKDGEIPYSYMMQLQWYMYITNVKFGYFAVLIGGNKYLEQYVEYDKELMHLVLPLIINFWANNVKKNLPPKFDGSDDAENYIKNLYPKSNENTIDLDDNFIKDIERLDVVKDLIKDLEVEKKSIEQKIKGEMKDNAIAHCLERKISYKTQLKTSLDSKKLKDEQPEIYEKYAKVSEMRVLRIN